MKDKAYRKAEQKIAVALRKRATKLDLSCDWDTDDSEKLTELPDSLGQLTRLQSLDLSHNRLRALPEWLGQLTWLQSLDLSSNQLSALPEWLGQLTRLQSLDLSDNQLSTLPESLGQLTQLESLDLSDNQLSTLPESLWQLSQLKTLTLSYNQLSDLPAGIGFLINLTSLSTDCNPITVLPPEIKFLTRLKHWRLGWHVKPGKIAILPKEIGRLSNLSLFEAQHSGLTELPYEIGYLSKLIHFMLNNNHLSDLPPSLAQLEHLENLDLDDNPLNPELAAAYAQGLDAVKAYLRAKAEGEQIILDEAKLILIGEGGVGKTSLLGALRGDTWVENRETTHGVEVDIKSLQLTDENSGKTITFNGWDFGGQNIYRHTHQLYFTAPAVYLAVWEPRRGPEQCAVAEWVKMVKQRAFNETRPDDRPRVLVVASHGGPKERLDHIDEQALRDEFGEIISGFHHVDSKTGAGLDELKKAIAREAAAIPSVGRSVPKSWKDVLDALRKRSEEEPYISYKQFKDLCRPRGVSHELADTYAAILNELGHIIHYRTDSVLQDTMILKAEWLSKAMSYVLEDKATKDRHGLVTHPHLSEIWDDTGRGEDRYPAAIHVVFIKLMERFDFSYRVVLQEAEAEPTSLIAQLVPHHRPDDWRQIWDAQSTNNSERTQVCRIVDAETGRTAEVEGLLYRLIVRLHRYSLGKRDYCDSRHWKTGMILDDGFNGRALLEEIGGDIVVSVRAAYPERFLAVLCEDVRWLVESFWKGLDCRFSVPCGAGNCKGLIEIGEMHDNLEEGIDKVRCPVCRTWHPIDAKLGTVAPKPEWSAALQELTGNQQQILSAVNDNYASLSTQLRTVMSQIDEQFAALMTTLTDPAKDGPRLFSIEAVNPGFWDKPKWMAAQFRLVLWCEHARLPVAHLAGDPSRGVYELELTREWLSKAAPLLKVMATTLNLALPIAAPTTKLLMDSADYQAIENQLKFGQSLAQSLLKGGEKLGDWLTNGDQISLETSQIIRAQGAVLRELQALLKEKDPRNRFGGLVRVQNKQREFLWVYEDFVDEY